MTIIPDQPGTAGLPEATAQAIADIQARIDGMTAVAHFLKATAALLPPLVTGGWGRVAVYLWFGDDDTAKASIERLVAAAATAGVRVTPYATVDKHAGVHLHFGPITVQVYGNAHALSERVQVVSEEWRSNIAIPEHAGREQPADGA